MFSLFCSVVCSVKFSYISPSEGHTSNIVPFPSFFFKKNLKPRNSRWLMLHNISENTTVHPPKNTTNFFPSPRLRGLWSGTSWETWFACLNFSHDVFNTIHPLRQISGCTFRGLDCLTTIDSDDEDSFIMDYEVGTFRFSDFFCQIMK